jgi:Transcription factor WhiB
MTDTRTAGPRWWRSAACRGTDPVAWELDVLPIGRRAQAAVNLAGDHCAACPVRAACLDDARTGGAYDTVRGGQHFGSDGRTVQPGVCRGNCGTAVYGNQAWCSDCGPRRKQISRAAAAGVVVERDQRIGRMLAGGATVAAVGARVGVSARTVERAKVRLRRRATPPESAPNTCRAQQRAA